MTREEQIKQAALEFENSPGDFDINTIADFFRCGAKWADDNPKERFCIDRVEANTMLSNLDIFNMSVNCATSSLDTETLLVNMAIEKCKHALQNIILSQKYTTKKGFVGGKSNAHILNGSSHLNKEWRNNNDK